MSGKTRARIRLLAAPSVIALLTCASDRPMAMSAEAVAAAESDPADDERSLAVEEVPKEALVFESVFDAMQDPPPLEPKLRGGTVARSADWPASFYAEFVTASGRIGSCTAALIGPQVLLTAAHCVPPNGTVDFRFDRRTYVTTCTRHDRYVAPASRDKSADFALCKVTTPFVQPVGFQFETIDDETPMASLVETQIVLAGYGCITDDAVNRVRDRKYRIGTNLVGETSQSRQRTHDARYYDPSELNNLFTKDDGANLCPGDSGGPAFVRAQVADPNQYARRRIVGVNSRVFYTDQTRTTYGSSLVSAIGGPDFKRWAEAWTQANALDACGLRGAIPNCRN